MVAAREDQKLWAKQALVALDNADSALRDLFPLVSKLDKAAVRDKIARLKQIKDELEYELADVLEVGKWAK